MRNRPYQHFRHIRGKTILINKGVNKKKHPGKIGSSWRGAKYIHGPRRHQPSKYKEFRLGKLNKDGSRIVFGRIKGSQKWEVQSTLHPKNDKKLLQHEDKSIVKILKEVDKEMDGKLKNVVEVPTRKLTGYDGMNPEAAREMGFNKKSAKHKILIDKGMSKKLKNITLRHELIEEKLMRRKRMKYFPAHTIATKYEDKDL